MIDIEKLVASLYRHEGLRLKPYLDSVDKLTIGVGRNLEDVGISAEEADIMLGNDIEDAENAVVDEFDYYAELDPVRANVIVEMAFNLGLEGLKGFKKMHAAMRLPDYKLAATEARDSKWYRQVKGRGERLAHMMETGQWPTD